MNDANDKYSWDTEKRESIIKERGLDIVEWADLVFADPDGFIIPDERTDYGEARYLAFALINGRHICLCFTPRAGKKHLITIFRIKEKTWRKYYGNKS